MAKGEKRSTSCKRGQSGNLGGRPTRPHRGGKAPALAEGKLIEGNVKKVER